MIAAQVSTQSRVALFSLVETMILIVVTALQIWCAHRGSCVGGYVCFCVWLYVCVRGVSQCVRSCVCGCVRKYSVCCCRWATPR